MAAAASMRFLVLTMIVRIIQVSVMWILMQTYLTSKCKNFLRRKVAKVSLKTVKATTTQPQVMNPRVSISDVYTSRMGSMDSADQLCSFYLLRVAIRYRYIFWFLFNVFVCNAFVLESERIGSKCKTLDFKLDLAHQRSLVYCNESEGIDGTRFLYWTMLYPQINMFQLVWRAEKGNVYGA